MSVGGSDSRSRGVEREKRNLRWAIETDRDANSAETAIDVELQRFPKRKPSLSTYLWPNGGKNHWSNERHAHLATVGVTSKHERNSLPLRKSQQGIDVVGSMTKQHDGLVRHVADGLGNRLFGVRRAHNWIVDAGKPESGARAFNGDMRIVEHGDGVRRERLHHRGGPNFHVVIAENGIAVRTLKLDSAASRIATLSEMENRVRHNPVRHKVAS